MTVALPLKDLFVYPIERYIPPVAKVNDVAEVTVETDLREYVVTTPIEQALLRFFEIYADSRNKPTDKIGVWISGFFGSGKSHFAKILSYLLNNPMVVGEPARTLFVERLGSSDHRLELEGLLHRIGLLDNRTIMFQIKAEQDQTDQNESISEILYRRYLAGRGLSTHPAVAALELSLMERGLFDAFASEVARRKGRPWTEEREDFLFIRDTVAEALQAVTPQTYRSRDEALDALKLLSSSQGLAISDLAERLVAYVDEVAATGDPERPPRLVFILDEIGQFVGTDGQKLLELQTIAEEFANRGRGKLWLIVTAQARLHELIAGVKELEADFGKIGDRFDTRLALTSEDVERVLAGRILKKKPEREPEIEAFYYNHAGTLAMLSTLPGTSRDLPEMTAGSFSATTPFLPYHLSLIQAVFDNVRGATATGFGINPEARSMIGMAQGVLRNPANGFVNGSLGHTVALDMVYDQIAVDLQPQDKQEIATLAERLPAFQMLDQRVLKVLYLLQHVPWLAVTADTLAHALVRNAVDENLVALHESVLASLERLRQARYVVAKEDGVWEFLTGTKKSFEEDLAGVRVRQTDQRRECRNRLAEVLRSIGKLNYKEGLRSFDVTVQGDGETMQPGQELVLEVYSPLHVALENGFSLEDLEQIESFAHSNTVYWVAAANEELPGMLTRLIRLGEVLQRWQAKRAKTDDEREIIREKQGEQSSLRNKIETSLRSSLINGTIVWNGRAEELDGRTTTLNPIFNRTLAQVVPYVYPKFDLAAVKPNEKEIEAILTMAPYALQSVGAGLDLFDSEGHLNQHSAVVDEVRRELQRRSHRGGDLSGRAVEEHFSGGDYGWHPTIVRLVLAAMFRAGVISAKTDNVHYSDHSVPAAQTIFTQVRPFRRAVFFYEEAEAVTPDELRRASDELKLIFETSRRDETANALAEQIDDELKQWRERAERVVLQLRPTGYPIPASITGGSELCDRVTRFRNPGKIVKAFLENLEEVRAWHQEVHRLYDFVREKRHVVFERGRKLLAEIRRAEGVPGMEPLAQEDAQAWVHLLEELIDGGQAAQQWDRFRDAYTPLRERYRRVYEDLHHRRDQVATTSRQDLETTGVPARSLDLYVCSGLQWDEDGIGCQRCNAPLRELHLQIVAIPNLLRQLREQYHTSIKYGDGNRPPTVAHLSVRDSVPNRRLQSPDDIDEALATLRETIITLFEQYSIVELD